MIDLRIAIITHLRHCEGGLHTHIADRGMLICGCKSLPSDTMDKVTLEFLYQPDPNDELCKTCRKKAIEILKPKRNSFIEIKQKEN